MTSRNRRAAAAGEEVVFDGRAGRLVGTRWTAVGRRRGVALLLHGAGQTRHSWFDTAASLAAARWDAVALDVRGHGDSDWAPDGDYGMGAMVADLRAVVGQIGEPPLLLGASMGGLISLVAEGEHTGTARALLLVDVVPHVEPVGVARIVSFMRAHRHGFASLDEVAEAIRAYNPGRTRTPSKDGLRKNVRQRADGRWYWHWDPAFLAVPGEPPSLGDPPRAMDAARRVAVPTLLVRGARSDVVSTDRARELLALIPGSRYREVPAAGHMMTGDDNAMFTAAVVGFLAELVVDGS